MINEEMIRVFPRKTNATPDGEKVYLTGPPLKQLEDRDVRISCTFTWDRKKAESLAKDWEMAGYDVSVGGPAYDDPGLEFIPNRFVKTGYVFTSRGCNNNCWFCSVPHREGSIRELPICDGWRLLDSNLLQCSEKHIKAVFAMLKRQPLPVSILGGLEAKILKDWHVDLISKLTISQIYFAYDTKDDYEPLTIAAQKIFKVFSSASHRICCYVLIGYKNDTFSKAEARLKQTMKLGFLPFAMLYKNDLGESDPQWISFQAQWANPVKIYGKKKRDESYFW